MKKQAIFLVVAVAVVLNLGSGALANEGFSTSTIAGTFAFVSQGENSEDLLGGSIPKGAPLVVTGLLSFSSNGSCTGTGAINLGTDIGHTFIVPLTVDTCEFNVETNGTGTIVFTNDGPTSPVELFITIVNEDKIFVIGSDELIQSGVLERQDDDGDNDD